MEAGYVLMKIITVSWSLFEREWMAVLIVKVSTKRNSLCILDDKHVSRCAGYEDEILEC